ncbi:MAG TPA: cation-transporting P-type ATPase, partial [Fimbriimonadaceae bacterium]|nr:cation-transporting P-type ATPase [Fimbriimonadaceae bacterium]
MREESSRGLTTSEAEELLAKFGRNELPTAKPKSLARISLTVVQEPMLLLLFGAVAVYVMIGDHLE